MVCTPNSAEVSRLKTEVLAEWLDEERTKRFPDTDERVTTWASSETLHEDALASFDRAFTLPGEHRFVDVEPLDCPIVPRMHKINCQATITARTGAFLFRFRVADGDETVEVLMIAAATDDDGWISAVANLPRGFAAAWNAFEKEVYRLAVAEQPSNRVKVIGGRDDSFEANVDWSDVVLPAALKAEIMEDISGFFAKGIDVYTRLKLKPFRKLLLAGVPGTGKTMLCAALAKWALGEKYLVIYISSSGRWRRGDGDGASFEKIDHALTVAAKSDVPTLLIVEELDIYLRKEHKALILNVLDGSEAPLNTAGTLMLATTNYPEAIDERVLKRPGRLDRIFIIPEARAPEDAEKLLRTYLGDLWQDAHLAIVPQLIGYPGAFIREVAVYALTQIAYIGGETLPLDVLESSLKRLKDQLEARDDFLKRRDPVGFAALKKSG